ncbi:MAG TPA: 3-dehydroquinate synthase [Bacteroidota bacterium]|nr:3-dehydroquinate synthase [Bacteroidota bacterium]
MKQKLGVRLPAGSDRRYPVLIGAGALRELPAILLRQWGGRPVFVVTDTNVGRLYGRAVMHDLHGAGLDALLIDIPAGEKSKSIDVYYAVITALLENTIRRGSVVVALGGGVVGDLAGFAAATVLRGVPSVQVPTTLLAQVDSSVGGKVGIDHPLGKNLIGAFHQPSAVVIDPTLLKTLPRAEFRNGMAEVLKIAVALDAQFFSLLERKARDISPAHVRLLSKVIATSVALKAAVVARDERESGLRKALNLGHTLGHAIEAATSFRLRHGEAVAIGMMLEGRLAVTLGLLDVRDLLRMQRVMDAAGLPTRLPARFDMKRLLSALALDKKRSAGAHLFVLPRGMGKSAIDVPVPPLLIRSVLT